MALSGVLKKLFGTKSERDMKKINPLLEEVLSVYPQLDKLSNDELRERCNSLKIKLRECEAPFEKRINEISAEMEQDIPIKRKEELASESDRLVKEEDEAIEKTLDEILPEAFSIMKSTARRFCENEFVEVTAVASTPSASMRS